MEGGCPKPILWSCSGWNCLVLVGLATSSAVYVVLLAAVAYVVLHSTFGVLPIVFAAVVVAVVAVVAVEKDSTIVAVAVFVGLHNIAAAAAVATIPFHHLLLSEL
ncbi:hypothetical protein [Leptolyngbya sp. FACHB-711]|uniref:hypothetical protein n=1 Tax=Leptolyngbya sp. FACHB-711 TaxID=2692813 RepID=UPI001685B1EA|nr:hypothetical protein [Leptolyngbya sp. FACHB-711]MBD2023823.1 hypothetical protein [Leptolyngbya sp. FACHB-711]